MLKLTIYQQKKVIKRENIDCDNKLFTRHILYILFELDNEKVTIYSFP